MATLSKQSMKAREIISNSLEIKHTPTPWNILNETESKRIALLGDSGFRIVTIEKYNNSELAKANAEHIVKCVNIHDDILNTNKTLRLLIGDEQAKTKKLMEFAEAVKRIEDLWLPKGHASIEFTSEMQALGKMGTDLNELIEKYGTN